MRNSGQSRKFWTPNVAKVVGVPRFELGTPCTPCGGPLAPKSLAHSRKILRGPSRIVRGSQRLTHCPAKDSIAHSGRFIARHGRYLIYRVWVRGKPTLRYIPDVAKEASMLILMRKNGPPVVLKTPRKKRPKLRLVKR